MFCLFLIIIKKKEFFFLGDNLQDFLLLVLLDIVCIFTRYLNSMSINSLCLDTFESI
jgi:hypothetical protein